MAISASSFMSLTLAVNEGLLLTKEAGSLHTGAEQVAGRIVLVLARLVVGTATNGFEYETLKRDREIRVV